MLTIISILFSACQKDFNTISVSQWHPSVAAPFFNTEVTFSDVIGSDSNIVNQNDSALVFVYHLDSILSVNADSLLQTNVQANYNYSFSLGILQIDNFNITDSVTVNDMLPLIDTIVANSLSKYDGKQNIFPDIRIKNSYESDLTGLDSYQQLTFSSGTIIINTRNSLPITIDTLFYNLYDIDNDTILKSVELSRIAPGTSRTNSINLAGISMSNNIQARITKFSGQATYPDSVLINLKEGLTFNLVTSNLQVVSGVARIPQQIFSEQKIMDFDFKHGEELNSLLFESGNINYDIKSSLGTKISVHMELPSALENNSIPSKDIQITSNGTTQGDWDLSNTTLDLTTDNSRPFNRFPITFSASLPENNQMVAFDSSNRFTANFKIQNIKLASVQGYLGQQNYIIDPDSVDINLDFLKKLKGELILDDPKLILSYKNSFGIPLQINTDFVAINSENGSRKNLNLDTISFLYPSTPGQSVNGTVTVDKSNSSIVDFLSLRPTQINFSGNVLTNPEGKHTDFVSRDAQFNADAEIRIPFILHANQLQFSDTISDLRISKDDFPIQSGSIQAKIINGFPFKIKIQLSFPDSISGQTLTTLDFGTIASALVDNNGKVTKAVLSKINVDITKDFFNKVAKANSGILHVETTTFNNGTVPVQLYSDYNAKVSVGFSATLKP